MAGHRRPSGRRGHHHAPLTTPPTPNTVQWDGTKVVPATGGPLDGLGAIALDTSAGSGDTAEPTQNAATGAAEPRAKMPTRLRSISSVIGATAQRPSRQERVDADYGDSTPTNGGAIISTSDAVSLGFGLEQVVDPAVRSQVAGRLFGHLLPAAADAAAPQVTWLRPGDGATVNAADPVEIEVEAVDERGDVKEVRLSVGDQLVQRKVSFSFQMRWYPSPDAAGDTVTLSVAAEDKAGNVTTSTRTITVGAAKALEESPLPTGVTTIAGKPVLGETLTCIPSGSPATACSCPTSGCATAR